MKIVIIHGQTHRGTSYHIGRALAEKLGSAEDITEFFLPKDMPHFCCGCYSCLKSEKHCPHYAALQPITQSIDAADLLVFTTPVYCLRATAAMKALFEHYFVWWASHRPKEEMYFKKAVVIAVGAGAGMKKAAADIKTNLSYWGISEIWTYGQRSQAMSWEGVNDKIRAEIDRKVAKLAGGIRKSFGTARISQMRKMTFFAMRLMQLRDWGACPEDKEYWHVKGWLGKNRPWKQPAAEMASPAYR